MPESSLPPHARRRLPDMERPDDPDRRQRRGPASGRARSRQGQVRAGREGGPLGLRHRTDGAGLRQRHRAGRAGGARAPCGRSEEHTSELQSHLNLVCRLLLEKKKKKRNKTNNIKKNKKKQKKKN